MLPNIIIRPCLLIDIIPLEPTIRRILTIHPPTNTLRLKQINNGLATRRDSREAITRDPVRGASNGSNVVWLRGMRDGEVVGEEDALGGYGCEICCSVVNNELADGLRV